LVAQCQFLISDKIAQAINFRQLANDLSISDRTLQRRFKKATGLSPLQYQQIKRIESSKALLMNSNETIEGIASLVGYLDSSQFARIFKKHNLQTPAEYRKTVRGKLFASD
jgi:transcriptional regulator GlxA family with amidase domain